MKFNLTLNNILLLPLFLMFFPAFAFYLPGLKGVYLYFFIVLYVCIGLILILDGKKNINNVVKIVKNSPMKILIMTLSLMIVNSLLLIIIGKSGFSSIRSIIMQIGLFVLPIIFYFSAIIGRYISYEKFIKLFLILFWINLNIGFIAYIGQLFNIEIINSIFDFFANERLLGVANSKIEMQASNYVAFGLPRLDNLFAEPGFYAQFLYIFLPLIFAFSQSKYSISKNKIFNIIIKQTIVPYTLISIILTLSPIYLVLTILLSIIYYFKEIVILIKRYNIHILIFLTTFVAILFKIDWSETYLSRIINIVINVKSFDDFILIEPSLASRIVSYINSIIVFFKHPFTGVGFGNINLSHVMYNQLLHSPVSLTPEIILKTNAILYDTNRVFINKGYIYTFLAENGIFITGLLTYFYIRLFKCLNILQKYNTDSFNYTIIKGSRGCLIGIFIIIFYNLQFLDMYLYLIIVLIAILICNNKIKKTTES